MVKTTIYFNGRHYLKQFWPENPKSSDVWEDNKFLLSAYIQATRFIKKTHGKNLACIDISTGPVLAPTIVLAPLLKSLQLSDYCASGRKTFLSTPLTYWNKYSKEILSLEKRVSTQAAIKKRLHKVDALIHEHQFIDVDLFRQQIFKPSIHTSSVDLFTMHFVADSITPSKKTYTAMIARVAHQMKPGSVLFMSCLIESSQWSVGKKTYPSPNLSVEYITDVLKKNGFICRMVIAQPAAINADMGHDGRMAVITAEKKRTVKKTLKKSSIPSFPKFTPLSPHHKEAIHTLTKMLHPYSDYNFTSLYCWNLDGQSAVSRLHGNLIIKMKDYTTDNAIFGFIGNNNIVPTAKALMKITERLHLIPESVAKHLEVTKKFSLQEHPDSHDYILNLEHLATYPGHAYKAKRNAKNAAERQYKSIQLTPCPLTKNFQKEINALLTRWMENKKAHYTEYDELGFPQLRSAINRTFDLHKFDHVQGARLTIGDQFAGFILYEDGGNGYIIAHFINGDTELFPYIYEILYNRIGMHFASQGFKYLNIEQDLGIPYMKKTKSKWIPDHFLKKYIVTRS